MESYAAIMFSDAARTEQEKAGMAQRFEAMYRDRHRGPLDEDTRAFLASRTSFYMASITQSGFPYIQHRGGPVGFVRVTGPEQIAFADYAGNKQFITTGNLATSPRVSLFFMDYPRRARLKMIGTARMIPASDDPALAEALATPGAGPVERLCSIDIAALDWNCPKYITPRFTEDEIAPAIERQLSKLTQENQALRARLAQLEAGEAKP